MPRKPKFRPVITRVKLNPEQAVLTCNCYDQGRTIGTAGTRAGNCYLDQRQVGAPGRTSANVGSS